MAGDRRGQPWAQMLQQNDEKHDDAHRRLRADHRELEELHEALKAKVTSLEGRFELSQQAFRDATTAPIDIGKIVFNPKMVMAIVGLAISIVGGNWFINQPIREDLGVLKEQIRGNTKIEDERSKVVKDAIDSLSKAIEMRRLEIQQVSNSVQQLQRSH